MILHPALALVVLLLQDGEGISKEEFAARRAKVVKAVGTGAAILEAGRLSPRSGDDRNTPVFHFKYLTGFHDDRGVLVLGPAQETLFVDRPEEARKWGFRDVHPAGEFEAWAGKNLPRFKKASIRLGRKNEALVRKRIPSSYSTLAGYLQSLRLLKSAAELRLIRKATAATVAAHRAILRVVKPGVNEGVVQKTIEDTFKANGCPDLGFPSICGSGKNGTILHYSANKDPLPKDSLIVCDIGAAVHNYVTDITRTLPTAGKFTPKQRRAYQAVLDAQKAAEKLLKPGATLLDLHHEAARSMKASEYTKWSFAHGPRGSGVRHGIGHFVGMAVHDSGSYRTKLEPGMVVTIEPGWYDKDEGWGIRIEDMYLVTPTGFERLSAGAPREIDEIEKAMK